MRDVIADDFVFILYAMGHTAIILAIFALLYRDRVWRWIARLTR